MYFARDPVIQLSIRRSVVELCAVLLAGGLASARSPPAPSLGFSLAVKVLGFLSPKIDKVIK